MLFNLKIGGGVDYPTTQILYKNSLADSLSSSVNSNGIDMSLYCSVR